MIGLWILQMSGLHRPQIILYFSIKDKKKVQGLAKSRDAIKIISTEICIYYFILGS